MAGDMTLKSAWKCYFRFILLNIALWIVFVLGKNLVSEDIFDYLVWIPIGFYLYSGIWLNRHVLRNLPIDYHPLHNTIDNVHRVKQGYMVFWIFKYPYLLYQLWSIKTI